MSFANQLNKNIFHDPSLWFLLFSNLTTIYLAIKEGWDFLTIILIYWAQSIIIGFFNFVRIIQLKEFSTEGVKINDQPVSPTKFIKIYIAFFFLIHYGLFHFLCFFALRSISQIFKFYDFNLVQPKVIILPTLIFFFNHLFSYIYNKERDIKKLNIGALMYYPYFRVFPIHFIIFFSDFLNKFFTFENNKALLIFLILKTIADCRMHIFEHNQLRGGKIK